MGVPSEALPQGYLSPAPLFPWGGHTETVSHCLQGSEEVSPFGSGYSYRCETKELQMRIDSQWVFPQLAVQPFGVFCFSIIPFDMWVMNITTFHYFFHCIY